MKSWKEEKLYRPSQSCKILREQADSDDGYEEVYKYAYKLFTDAINGIYNKLEDKYDLDTVEYALNVAVTNAFDEFSGA